ncbi:MAG: ferrochelatase [Elusimicrobia bacterium]|nr:MAG: ferrochelatase [Elusimicrobiota bacterium]
MTRRAVLLMAHGAADTLSEIPSYLQGIFGKRPLPEGIVDQVTERYKKIGGRSPLKTITNAQANGLQDRLGEDVRVYVGMRHWSPWIEDVVAGMRKDGVDEIVAVPLTPYDSAMSVGAYLRALSDAIAATGGPLAVREVRGWHLHPQLIDAYAARISEVNNDPEACLLLTAHSLPARVIKEGDRYAGSLAETAQAVHERSGLARMEFAYQSAGAGGREPWLGPDAGEVLERLKEEGVESVLLSPIGFVSEHMETLYDDDILYAGKADALGLRFSRAKALNDHPAFLDVLADVVQNA